MEWLDLDLPAQSAFQLEYQRREVRGCNDPVLLQAVAEGLLQEVHHLSNVVNQLTGQVADLEVQLAQAGAFPEPSQEHYRWVREVLEGPQS